MEVQESGAVSFYHEDFSFEQIQRETGNLPLPPISAAHGSLDGSSTYQDDWDIFFSKHKKGSFFKCRRYICEEFGSHMSDGQVLLEVGCGYGCTMLPILKRYPSVTYIATDFSENALKILQQSIEGLPIAERVRFEVLDITASQPARRPDGIPTGVLCIFALSAIDSCYHERSIEHIYDALQEDGFVLFRDYAIHDMTMYRHTIRLGETLFQRSDKTLAFYFDLAYIDRLFCSAGFRKIELRYDCVLCRNKKQSTDMKRVFVHAVYKKMGRST